MELNLSCQIANPSWHSSISSHLHSSKWTPTSPKDIAHVVLGWHMFIIYQGFKSQQPQCGFGLLTSNMLHLPDLHDANVGHLRSS